MTQPHHEDLPWYQFEAKIREINQKDALDFEKISSEFSKLIVSNLFMMNAGGLGSIPAVSIFLDLNKLSVINRIELLKCPFITFGFGAFLALASAFAAYINYQAGAAHSKWTMRNELSMCRKFHPAYQTNEEFSKMIEAEIVSSRKGAEKAWKRLRCFLWVSIGCGFGALLAFIVGCVLLGLNVPALRTGGLS
jgi:hypothetical protein